MLSNCHNSLFINFFGFIFSGFISSNLLVSKLNLNFGWLVGDVYKSNLGDTFYFKSNLGGDYLSFKSSTFTRSTILTSNFVSTLAILSGDF